jgi:hypothetical protein
MRLDLGTAGCTRDHGYVEELDRVDPGAAPLEIDAGAARAISPLAAVRIAMIAGAAQDRGCEVKMLTPRNPDVASAFEAYSILRPASAAKTRVGRPDSEVILGCTLLQQLTDVDLLANALTAPLVDHFSDVAVVQDAVLMAFSELCQNAIEHGSSPPDASSRWLAVSGTESDGSQSGSVIWA